MDEPKPAAADVASLRASLMRLDGRSYRAYRELRGGYAFERCEIHVDHVQRDPFAAPSKFRLRVAQTVAGIPGSLFDNRTRRVALEDFIARRVRDEIQRQSRDDAAERGSGRSGEIWIDAGGPEVLERTAAVVTPDWVEVRIEVGLPAAGRRILGRVAQQLLIEQLPAIAEAGLARLPLAAARSFVDCIENQQELRRRLSEWDLVAFVGDGAVLPRASGASERPLPGAVPFESPQSLCVELPLLHPIRGAAEPTIRGLGIRRGVTLIVGGGYHGKSTLLRAIERGVYPHVPGDGREWVVTDPGLVKIRAEDGRRVENVDIGGFVGELPQGRSTRAFRSDDASGSTSQAANIVEALEAGASGLLLDEDSCATNFMLRDGRMQALVHGDDEPIIPFVERVGELRERFGVSTILVVGASGAYFDVADCVIAMREFAPRDVTDAARRVAESRPAEAAPPHREPLRAVVARIPIEGGFDVSRGRRGLRIAARGVDRIEYGRESIDLRGVEQLVDESQTRAIGYAIALVADRWVDGSRNLSEILDELERHFDASGLDGLDPRTQTHAHSHTHEHAHLHRYYSGNFARPRRYEIAAAINRLRVLCAKPR